jgi:hypothetical protein
MSSGASGHLSGVWGSSGSDVYAVGYTILHYDGRAWSSICSGIPLLGGVWGSSGSDVFAVGPGGTILHYGPRMRSTLFLPLVMSSFAP